MLLWEMSKRKEGGVGEKYTIGKQRERKEENEKEMYFESCEKKKK